MKTRYLWIGLIFLVISTIAQATSIGPTSTYWVAAEGNGYFCSIQGGASITTACYQTVTPTNGVTAARAFTVGTSTIQFAPDPGQGSATTYQYTLSGALTGTSYSNPNPSNYPNDGTSDGVHNYFLDYFSGELYQAGLDWSNITPMLNLASGYGSGTAGVAYDGANDSFWLSDQGDTKLFDISRTGTILYQFNGGVGSNYGALAYDTADGTLWVSENSATTFLQFSTTGTLEQTINVTFPVGGLCCFFGGEIGGAEAPTPPVPEPATVGLLGLGLTGLARKLRKKA